MNLELGSRRLAAAWAALMLMAGVRRPLSACEIAAELGCHRRYLESDLQQLKRAGLIEGRRGKGGGYQLAKGPGRTTLWEVYAAMFALEAPEEAPQQDLLAVVHRQLAACAAQAVEAMKAYTLADALADARRQGAALRPPPEDFCI